MEREREREILETKQFYILSSFLCRNILVWAEWAVWAECGVGGDCELEASQLTRS